MTGWICPRCEVVHAPGVLRCECSPMADEREVLYCRYLHTWLGKKGDPCPTCGTPSSESVCTIFVGNRCIERLWDPEQLQPERGESFEAYEQRVKTDLAKRQEAAKARAEGEG